MKKKTQRIFAIIIAILVSFSMIGTAAFGYIYSNLSTPPSSSASAPSSTEQFKQQKSQVQSLELQAKAKPDDLGLQQQLADAYYDLGVTAQQVAPAEAPTDFSQAIQGYQKVLKNKKDINVLVDMATAAFYAGQNDLAEKSFKEALADKPDFPNALYNYGIFLAQAKNDLNGAIQLWQEALNKNPTGPDAENLKQLIAQAKSAQSAGKNPLNTPAPATGSSPGTAPGK